MREPPSFHYYSKLLVKKLASLQARYDSNPDAEQQEKITEERERFLEWASKVDLSGALTKVPLEDRIDLGTQILDFKLTLERIADIVYTSKSINPDFIFQAGFGGGLLTKCSGWIFRVRWASSTWVQTWWPGQTRPEWAWCERRGQACKAHSKTERWHRPPLCEQTCDRVWSESAGTTPVSISWQERHEFLLIVNKYNSYGCKCVLASFVFVRF